MYNSRTSHYRRQVLQPEQDHIEEDSPNVDTNMVQEPEASEPAASRQATPSQPPTRRPRSRQSVEPEREQENIATDSLYIKAVYEDPEALKFIKRMTWTRIPDTISKAARSIMTAHYKETLEAIAGSADDDVNADLEQNLRRTARSINQNIKTLMVPDTVDTKLLDPSTFTLKNALLDEIEPQKRKLAYDSLVLKKQIERFEQKTLEAEETMQKLRQVKELWWKLTNLLQSETPIKATDRLQDYAQSLILEPSSKIFESPE
ncbi:hypothetical protein MFLAVUS_007822 [Mucor flavus]|uniref:Uncharacterized protein n=1 Tax=Mucor flavus TaxID=439312 RepID=A0ABP9Z5E8_9FUNG